MVDNKLETKDGSTEVEVAEVGTKAEDTAPAASAPAEGNGTKKNTKTSTSQSSSPEATAAPEKKKDEEETSEPVFGTPRMGESTRRHSQEKDDGEPRKRHEGLGYTVTGIVLLAICGVMLAVLISSFTSASDLIKSLGPDRGYVGISVIVAIIVTIISAVGCIMASLASLYFSTLAISRSEGAYKYAAYVQMSLSMLLILASIALSVIIIMMA